MTCTVYQIWPRIHCLPCRANPFPSMINFIVAVDIIISLFCSACCSSPVCNSVEVELLGNIQQARGIIRFGEFASNQSAFRKLACSVLLYNTWEWIILAIIIAMKHIRNRDITAQSSGVTITQAHYYTGSYWITHSKKVLHWFHSLICKQEWNLDWFLTTWPNQTCTTNWHLKLEEKRAVWQWVRDSENDRVSKGFFSLFSLCLLKSQGKFTFSPPFEVLMFATGWVGGNQHLQCWSLNQYMQRFLLAVPKAGLLVLRSKKPEEILFSISCFTNPPAFPSSPSFVGVLL